MSESERATSFSHFHIWQQAYINDRPMLALEDDADICALPKETDDWKVKAKMIPSAGPEDCPNLHLQISDYIKEISPKPDDKGRFCWGWTRDDFKCKSASLPEDHCKNSKYHNQSLWKQDAWQPTDKEYNNPQQRGLIPEFWHLFDKYSARSASLNWRKFAGDTQAEKKEKYAQYEDDVRRYNFYHRICVDQNLIINLGGWQDKDDGTFKGMSED